MHPAASIIFFTTASGLGYGLLAWSGLLIAVGVLPADRWFGATVLGLALVLVSSGLLSSMFHLGRPERAWRALSQWRSSWLSREGLAAIVTYVPVVVLGLGWVIYGHIDSMERVAGIASAVASLATVYCTAMIYRSLVPIRQWSNSTTVPTYLGFALMSGATWLCALVQIFCADAPFARGVICGIAVVIIPVVFTIKTSAWQIADGGSASTVQSATGLKGEVRSLEWPHTEENFLLKEMGYRIARKHARKLRTFAALTAFIIPELLLAAQLGHDGAVPAALAGVAALSMMFGIAAERWLFFAEAKHTVTLYYGRST